MKKKRIVIALGHEALGSTLPEQQKAAARTAKAVADFIREDYQVVITHSNGPQVGMIHTAMNEFCRLYPEYTATPTSVCSAMSQGYIGYDLQNAIRTELLNRGIYKTVSTVLTQVVVDPYDEAFYHPTKVIGRVMTKEEAEEEEKKGNHVTEVEGVPTSVNGKEMKVSDIIRELNRLGGKHGVGIIDIVENRVVGMKSRGVYETPGGTILMEAHQQLEELVLDRATMEVKKDMGNKLAQIVYEGKWFTPLCDAVRAFVTSTQEYVTGEVKFKLYKGNIIKAGTTSKYSLYSESLASFTTGDLYDHHDASGFITLFGLPLKVRAMKMQEIGEKNKYED